MSQKEYLRKYLNDGDLDSLGKTKRKKKKRPAIGTKTVKIIDDDVDVRNIRPLRDGELEIFNTTEDAPQIVGIVDERGAPAVDFADKRRWRIIADDGDGNVTCDVREQTPLEKFLTKRQNCPTEEADDLSPPRVDPRRSKSKRKKESREFSDADQSPPRRKSKDEATRNSKSSKKSLGEFSDSDQSPPRRKSRDEATRNSKSSKKSLGEFSDSDQSPLRRKSKDEATRNSKSSKKSLREFSDMDQSPPRRKNKDEATRNSKSFQKSLREFSDSDQSPPRRKHKDDATRNSKSFQKSLREFSDSDQSPPRRKSKDEATRNSKSFQKSLREFSDSDQSPPRRKSKDKATRSSKSCQNSCKEKSLREFSDSDQSPPRRRRNFDDGRIPSKTRVKEAGKSKEDSRRPEVRRKSRDTRSRAKNRREDERTRGETRSRWKRGRSSDEKSSSDNDALGRMKKTNDGKTAGLQDARDLKMETEAHKKREAESFKQLSTETSGVGQAAIYRDRKTGRRRDFAAEDSQRREKEKRQAEIDEKYAKWGRGLKQVDDEAEKRQSDLYEMSKPLARYANDPDLDRALREVEREGDTMLDEIRQRRIKEGKMEPARPTYRGSCAPNRFGIKPGRRWDGVDRSNGYEKKWFEAGNARKAIAEEAYKWSTADM